jgi:hypothetical protein
MEDVVPITLMTGSFCGVWWILIAVQVVSAFAMMVVSIAGLAGWIWMIVDVIQREEKTFKSKDEKVIWVLVIVLAGWVGALIYYLVEYRRYKGLDSGQLL